jgi:hypothetical protein
MSEEIIENVFRVSDQVKTKAKLLTLDNWSPPNNWGICNVSWRNEKDVLNGCLLDKSGVIWCSCEYFNMRSSDDVFGLCKHLYRSMLFLLENDPKFLNEVIQNYVVRIGDEKEDE